MLRYQSSCLDVYRLKEACRPLHRLLTLLRKHAVQDSLTVVFDSGGMTPIKLLGPSEPVILYSPQLPRSYQHLRSGHSPSRIAVLNNETAR